MSGQNRYGDYSWYFFIHFFSSYGHIFLHSRFLCLLHVFSHDNFSSSLRKGRMGMGEASHTSSKEAMSTLGSAVVGQVVEDMKAQLMRAGQPSSSQVYDL